MFLKRSFYDSFPAVGLHAFRRWKVFLIQLIDLDRWLKDQTNTCKT